VWVWVGVCGGGLSTDWLSFLPAAESSPRTPICQQTNTTASIRPTQQHPAARRREPAHPHRPTTTFEELRTPTYQEPVAEACVWGGGGGGWGGGGGGGEVRREGKLHRSFPGDLGRRDVRPTLSEVLLGPTEGSMRVCPREGKGRRWCEQVPIRQRKPSEAPERSCLETRSAAPLRCPPSGPACGPRGGGHSLLALHSIGLPWRVGGWVVGGEPPFPESELLRCRLVRFF